MRRLAILATILGLVFAGCGGAAEDPMAALVPELAAAETILPTALVCPGQPTEEVLYDPLKVGTLEELSADLPLAILSGSSMKLVNAGERTRAAIWSTADARPVAMLFAAELEDGSYAACHLTYCTPSPRERPQTPCIMSVMHHMGRSVGPGRGWGIGVTPGGELLHAWCGHGTCRGAPLRGVWSVRPTVGSGQHRQRSPAPSWSSPCAECDEIGL